MWKIALEDVFEALTKPRYNPQPKQTITQLHIQRVARVSSLSQCQYSVTQCVEIELDQMDWSSIWGRCMRADTISNVSITIAIEFRRFRISELSSGVKGVSVWQLWTLYGVRIQSGALHGWQTAIRQVFPAVNDLLQWYRGPWIGHLALSRIPGSVK